MAADGEEEEAEEAGDDAVAVAVGVTIVRLCGELLRAAAINEGAVLRARERSVCVGKRGDWKTGGAEERRGIVCAEEMVPNDEVESAGEVEYDRIV